MTTQLGIYNQALVVHLGERRLTAIATSDKEQSQVELDIIWDNGAIDACLELTYWNFAMRSIQLTYNPSITPSFGYQYVFDKPSDHILTAAVCTDPYFKAPLLNYDDEAQYWKADFDTLYIKYVSNDNAYGNDMSLWPQSFEKVMACYLAVNTCERITQSRVKRADLEEEFIRLLDLAKAKDALAQPTKIPYRGTWARSRGSRIFDNTGGYRN